MADIRDIPGNPGRVETLHRQVSYNRYAIVVVSSYWRCTSRDICSARAVTSRVTSQDDTVTLITSREHTHPPTTDTVIRREAIGSLKRRLDDDPLLPVRSAYDNENAANQRDGKPVLPTFSSVDTILKRHKSTKLPALPHSRADVEITGDWAMTVDGRRLLLLTGDADMVVFATDDNLRAVCSDHHLC